MELDIEQRPVQVFSVQQLYGGDVRDGAWNHNVGSNVGVGDLRDEGEPVTDDGDESSGATAVTLPPALLRSLDAIHLATARVLGAEVSAFVTYDARLPEVARTLGLNVVSP